MGDGTDHRRASYDPWRRMGQLTRQVQADLSRLATALSAPDPESPDRKPQVRVSTSRSGPSDPTLAAITAATTTRLSLLDELLKILTVDAYPNADTRLDATDGLLDVTDRLDLATTHIHAYARQIATQAPQDRPCDLTTLFELVQGFRSAWLQLDRWVHDAGYDDATNVVLWLDERVQHRLAHRLRRLANRAHRSIIQPEHPAAGGDQAACSDPTGRQCRRFLAPGRKYGACDACRKAQQRSREAAR